MALQFQTKWTERGHRFARWSADSREVIRLYKARLQQQLTLSPRCGHLRGHGGVKGAVRYARVLSKQFAFVARFDIRSYHQSIDHRVMLAILSASGVSRDVFNVVQDYLCKRDVQRTGKGMVAGGSISPLLGAVYLVPLDRASDGKPPFLRQSVPSRSIMVLLIDPVTGLTMLYKPSTLLSEAAKSKTTAARVLAENDDTMEVADTTYRELAGITTELSTWIGVLFFSVYRDIPNIAGVLPRFINANRLM